jgi:deoxycytidylate deaminase
MLAVLTRGKSVIRVATNSTKTHPKYRRVYNGVFECHTLHAEMNALIWARPGDELQVFRFHEDGTEVSSLPCVHCMEAIIKAGISTLTYKNEYGDWVKIKINKGSNIPKGYKSDRYLKMAFADAA